jgi:mRNA interferase MazF
MMHTMIFDQGDVILLNFSFASGIKSKKRPCIVLSNNEYNKNRHEIIAAPITSQNNKEYFLGDYQIKDWKEAGLLKPSIFKCIVFTLEDTNIVKKIGNFTDRDMKLAIKSINSVFNRYR